MSKSASLPAQPFDAFDPPSNESATSPAWKQEVNQRLAAHRNRRGGPQDSADSRASESPRAASGRAAEAAARVAARYAKAPSYSELLAGEARAVVRAAGAAAEAARNAQAAAEAVLAGLESGPIASGLWEPHSQREAQKESKSSVQATPSAAPRWQDEPPVSAPEHVQVSTLTPWAGTQSGAQPGAQPRWEEALPVTAQTPQHGLDVWSEMRLHTGSNAEYRQNLERHAGHGHARRIEEEELFAEEGSDDDRSFDSRDPLRSATVEPVQHLPANLIEFPRELVATRKVRPRMVEGPHYNASHEGSQLSIFEVDPDLVASPAYAANSSQAVAPPEWASIELEHLEQHAGELYASGGEHQQVYVEHHYAAETSKMSATAVEELPVQSAPGPVGNSGGNAAPQRRSQAHVSAPTPSSVPAAELLVARLSDRLLAAVVDGALVTLAVVTAAVVVTASTSHPPTGRIALIASGCGLLLFGLLYQFLFLSYAEEGTLGMRYARIALCTFDDDNPTLGQVRQRIPALLLSALPAGLGLIWAMFDKDHLGWHDRMTRTYQRKY